MVIVSLRDINNAESSTEGKYVSKSNMNERRIFKYV